MILKVEIHFLFPTLFIYILEVFFSKFGVIINGTNIIDKTENRTKIPSFS